MVILIRMNNYIVLYQKPKNVGIMFLQADENYLVVLIVMKHLSQSTFLTYVVLYCISTVTFLS